MGPEYAHAEARKSPVVDGVVMRNHDGKEVSKFDMYIHFYVHVILFHWKLINKLNLWLQVRYPVLLTPVEKEMAREVCIAFSQAVSIYGTLNEHLSNFYYYMYPLIF